MAAADRYERLVEMQVKLLDTHHLLKERTLELTGEETPFVRFYKENPELAVIYNTLSAEVADLLDHIIINFGSPTPRTLRGEFGFLGIVDSALNTLSVEVLKKIPDYAMGREILKVIYIKEKIHTDKIENYFYQLLNYPWAGQFVSRIGKGR